MGFSLKNIFKGAAVAATGFVASKYLGPVAGKFATRAIGSLMGGDSGQGSGGNWQPTDTSITAPSFSGSQMGFEKASDSGSISKIRTADADELRYKWDNLLGNWFKNKDQKFT